MMKNKDKYVKIFKKRGVFMTIVFKISDNIKPSLIKYYKDYC